MSKEETYRQELIRLGVWQDAFEGELHQLCILERELSRTMKAWKATAADGKNPSVLDPHYKVITQQRSDILSHRESLGLTPKGLQRLRKSSSEQGGAGDGIGQKLDDLMAAVGGYDVVGSG